MVKDQDDVVTVLARQHRHLRALSREIQRQPRVRDGACGAELRRREQLLDQLRRCFVIHERSKQRYVWPALCRAWTDGGAIAGVAAQLRQRAEAGFVKYRWLSERDPRVDELIDDLLAGIDEHIALEEHLLDRMRRGLPEPVREHLGAKLDRRGFLVPTRPHPDLPSPRWAAAAVEPVLGAVDRLVEAFSFGPSGA
jgi:Hemerythrin HHE cation binding domain